MPSTAIAFPPVVLLVVYRYNALVYVLVHRREHQLHQHVIERDEAVGQGSDGQTCVG